MRCIDCVHVKADEDGGCPFLYCDEDDMEVVENGGECESYKLRPFEE